MSAAHVPTPWVLGGGTIIMSQPPAREHEHPVYIAILQRGLLCAANAEFLLRAVNNHDGLVALLRSADVMLEALASPQNPHVRELRASIHNALIEADGQA